MMELSSTKKWLLCWALLITAVLIIILGIFTLPANFIKGGGFILIGIALSCLMLGFLRKESKWSKASNPWVMSLVTLPILVGGAALIFWGGPETLNAAPEEDDLLPRVTSSSEVASLSVSPSSGRDIPSSTTEKMETVPSSTRQAIEEMATTSVTVTAVVPGPTIEIYMTETITHLSTIYIPNTSVSIPGSVEPVPSELNPPSEDPFNELPSPAGQLHTEESLQPNLELPIQE